MKTHIATLLLLALAAPLAADRAHDLASKAGDQSPEHCEQGLTAANCHDQHPTGCSGAQNPTYDAYLNLLKNETPSRDLAAERFVFDGDFPTLEAGVPSGITKNNHAESAASFADLGEGNIVAVIGYLYFVENTATTTLSHGPKAKGETCNCQLRVKRSFDYHLGIGFDPFVAGRIGHAHAPSLTTLQQTSIVAEMTPHTRPPKWTYDRVNKLLGKQVKVLGQLLFDNMHANPKDNCGWPNALDTCWRASAWEVHPIIQLYICANDQGCDENSPENDWTKLDDLP